MLIHRYWNGAPSHAQKQNYHLDSLKFLGNGSNMHIVTLNEFHAHLWNF